MAVIGGRERQQIVLSRRRRRERIENKLISRYLANKLHISPRPSVLGSRSIVLLHRNPSELTEIRDNLWQNEKHSNLNVPDCGKRALLCRRLWVWLAFEKILCNLFIFDRLLRGKMLQRWPWSGRVVSVDAALNLTFRWHAFVSSLKYSGNKLASFLHEGIPELGLDDVEPTVIDEISIALGEGPDAYRATFSNIEAYGVSNISLAQVRSDIDTYQFQLTYEIPRIQVRANFKSTGTL